MDGTLTTAARATGSGTTTAHPRLAELVVHLTGCRPGLAVAAVSRAIEGHAPESHEEMLSVVAEAMIAVRRIDLRDRTPVS